MNVRSPKFLSLVGHYALWHYGRAYSDMYNIWMNFLWFVFYFFSIGVLLNSLFDPWKRMGEEYPSGFHPELVAQAFIINTLMRLVGFITRLIVISIGLIFASVVFLLGILIFIIWTVMPVFFVALAVMGISLIVAG